LLLAPAVSPTGLIRNSLRFLLMSRLSPALKREKECLLWKARFPKARSTPCNHSQYASLLAPAVSPTGLIRNSLLAHEPAFAGSQKRKGMLALESGLSKGTVYAMQSFAVRFAPCSCVWLSPDFLLAKEGSVTSKLVRCLLLHTIAWLNFVAYFR